MPNVKLPFYNTPYRNIDEVAIDNINVDLINFYVDDTNTLVKRCGGVEFVDLNQITIVENETIYEPVTDLFYWDSKKLMMAVCNGHLFKIDKDGNYTQLTNDNVKLYKHTPASICMDDNYFYITNGGKILYTDGNTVNYLEYPAPYMSTSIAIFNDFILANDTMLTKVVYFTDDHINWTGELFSCSVKPDRVVSIVVDNNEILIFGEESIERWYYDGVSPFRRSENYVLDNGTIAPYSIIKLDTLYFLDKYGNFARLNGIYVEPIQTPYDKIIKALKVKNDTRTFKLTMQGRDFVILDFPSGNLTLGWNFKANKWFRLSNFDNYKSEHNAWIGQCACEAFNNFYVGSRYNSKILKIDDDYYKDNDNLITSEFISGFYSFDTLAIKNSNGLIMRIKKTRNSNNKILFYFRNEDKKWSNTYEVDLSNNNNFIINLKQPMGTFIARQYKILHSEPCELIIGSIEENINAV